MNLSDLAAMAARPLAAVVSLALPRAAAGPAPPLELAIALYEGLLPLAEEFDVAIAGGDTNTHDGPLVICVTAFGEVTGRGPLTRSGGRPGDWLLVTGTLGGSILGHHFDFTPRVREALLAARALRAPRRHGHQRRPGARLCRGWRRKAAAARSMHTDHVPISRRGPHVYRDPLQHALGDGEDFELLLAVPPDVAEAILRDQPLECPITCVGELVAGSGLWQQSADGTREPLRPAGWQH